MAVEIVDLSDQNVTAVDDGSPWFLFLYAPWCQVLVFKSASFHGQYPRPPTPCRRRRCARPWSRSSPSWPPSIPDPPASPVPMQHLKTVCASNLHCLYAESADYCWLLCNIGIADRFNVRGFPTMIVIDGGRHMEYRGPRDESSLARVADRLATEAVTPLTGDLLLDGCAHVAWLGFCNRFATRVIGCRAATVYVACGAQIPEGFGDAAGRLRLENGFHVAPNTHPRCPAPDTVVAYAEGRPFDQHSFIAPGLEEWIHSHRLGVVRELGRGNGSTVGLHQIEGSTRPLVVLATVDKRCIDTLSKVRHGLLRLEPGRSATDDLRLHRWHGIQPTRVTCCMRHSRLCGSMCTPSRGTWATLLD